MLAQALAEGIRWLVMRRRRRWQRRGCSGVGGGSALRRRSRRSHWRRRRRIGSGRGHAVRAGGGHGGARDSTVGGADANQGGRARGRAPQRTGESVAGKVRGGEGVRHPVLPNTRAGKEEWERVLREVVASTAMRHGELAARSTVDCGELCESGKCGAARGGARRGGGVRRGSSGRYDGEAKGGAEKATPVGLTRWERVIGEWKAAMRASWSGVVPRPAEPW